MEGGGGGGGELTVEMLPEGPVGDVLDDDDPLVLVLQVSVESDQVQVLDAGQDLDLALEFHPEVLVVDALREEEEEEEREEES